MRQLRTAIRLSMRSLTITQAAGLADCAENTLLRILRGENVSILTAARIVEALGQRLDIRLAPPPNPRDMSVAP